MEWKGLGSAAVTATPMTSNTMPRMINRAKIKRATATPAPLSTDSDARLSAADRATAMQKTVKAHRYGEDSPLFFFSSLGFFAFFKQTSSIRRSTSKTAKPTAAKKVNLTA